MRTSEQTIRDHPKGIERALNVYGYSEHRDAYGENNVRRDL